MSGASWLRWSLASLMIAVTCYHLVRLAAARAGDGRRDADVDLTHAAMGMAMSLMLAGALTAGSSRAWAFVFTVPVLWFVCRTLVGYIRRGLSSAGGPLRQAVVSTAMFMMLLIAGAPAARAGTSGMSTMRTMGTASAAGGRLLVLVLVAAVAVVGITTARQLRAGAGSARLSPGCQLAMNVTTVYMLLLLL